ncbi:hypothetical protein C0Q70_10300 [Pomacea canaliculata]|uniref:F-box domain-containing protein n=1 Tax=Pomacea canaliculata TaxID=400727 RepID=A0A2T7PC80_POMCA|nr:hypothetical protein C0Q70_10300 [Pomacea canaliculata]
MATFSSERRQDELLEFSDHSSGDDNTSVVVKICAQERTYGLWWKLAPSAPKPYKKKFSSFYSEDYIVVSFEERLYPVAVKIYETYNPGAVVKILAADSLSGTSVDTGKTRWLTLWSGKPVETPQRARIFSPPLQKIDSPINMLRLELCHQLMHYYTELDCVVLCGTKQRLFSEGTETQKLPQFKPFMQDHSDAVADDLKALTLNDFKEISHLPGEACSGLFEILPAEVVLLILSYLDILSLCTLAQTCRLLRDQCYDHILYIELDLQPVWHLVCNSTLLGLAKRCQYLQRLNLSWCGKAAAISNTCFGRFLQDSQSQLTSIQLNCCPFVNSETLRLLATYCQDLREIDLSSCEQVDSIAALQLMLFKKLDRLNLYRTNIDLHSITCVIRSCPEIQHINLGSCSRISNYTEVAFELGNHCPKLKTLDFWRARFLTDDGLIHLANKCPLLEELDLGWWTVCDLDILALAKNSHCLQQLDILGTREVTCQAAEKYVSLPYWSYPSVSC